MIERQKYVMQCVLIFIVELLAALAFVALWVASPQ